MSDVVGPEGMVYAVEFSHRFGPLMVTHLQSIDLTFVLHRSGRDLLNMAKKRTNVVPIIEDARHPHKYRMLIPMVDCVFADVAQPDQVTLLFFKGIMVLLITRCLCVAVYRTYAILLRLGLLR